MSTTKNISVIRTYKHEPDDCARALALLLNKSVNKEAAHPAAPNEAKGLHHGRPAQGILPK